MKKRPGFTLAEVLITLLVVGTIAIATIPTLVKKYQQEVTIQGVKKFYSILDNVVTRAEADNGAHSRWDYYVSNHATDMTTFADKYIEPYVNYTKRCGYQRDNFTNCLYGGQHKVYVKPDGTTPLAITGVSCFSGGNGTLGGSGNCNYFMLQDGSILAMVIRTFGGTGNGTLADGGCVQFSIDLNGPLKGPNAEGKDVFDWVFLYKGVARVSSASASCIPTDGGTCANKIRKDGWQIKSDYAW